MTRRRAHLQHGDTGSAAPGRARSLRLRLPAQSAGQQRSGGHSRRAKRGGSHTHHCVVCLTVRTGPHRARLPPSCQQGNRVRGGARLARGTQSGGRSWPLSLIPPRLWVGRGSSRAGPEAQLLASRLRSGHRDHLRERPVNPAADGWRGRGRATQRHLDSGMLMGFGDARQVETENSAC